MRIAYVAYWDLSASDGVARKIAMQSRLWRDAGNDVEIFALRPSPLRTRITATRTLAREVRSWRPDVLYLRHDLYLPALWRTIRGITTVVELNEDDLAELRLRSRAAFVYGVVNRAVVLRAADGVVAVAESLRVSLRPTVVIANGLDPADVPALPAPVQERPVAVFLGSPRMPWHGVDRIVALAARLPGLDFELIGPSVDELVVRPPNVRARGLLTPAEYRPILGRADVAFGSLAMHRAGLTEASPLKVREYLLSGIPTVIGYDDTDFPDQLPWYLLHLPPTADPAADAREVARFLEGVRGRRVPRAEAEDRLGAPAKERARLDFLTRIRADAAPRRRAAR